MKMNVSVFVVVLLLLGLNSSVIAANIGIPGTGDGVSVLKAVATAYKEETGDSVRVPESIGSSGGVVAAGTSKAEIARVARNIKEKEKHFGLSYKKVFSVPVVFFVNKSVEVDNLSSKQILDIFSGKTSNWSEVDGGNAEIIVICREKKDSSYNNLKKSFPGFKDLVFSDKARMAMKTNHMVKFVLHEKDAIGFGPLDVALANGLKVISVEGKKPTDSGYPYLGTIGLVYKPENMSEASQKFLDFITSPKAVDSITKAGGIASI